jgi:hypothetical protein
LPFFAAPHVRLTRASQAVRLKRGEPTSERVDGLPRHLEHGCETCRRKKARRTSMVYVRFCLIYRNLLRIFPWNLEFYCIFGFLPNCRIQSYGNDIHSQHPQRFQESIPAPQIDRAPSSRESWKRCPNKTEEKRNPFFGNS